MANHKAIVVMDDGAYPFLDVLRNMDTRTRDLMLKPEWDSEQAFVDFYVETHQSKPGQAFSRTANSDKQDR
jgi:hypothetical protein